MTSIERELSEGPYVIMHVIVRVCVCALNATVEVNRFVFFSPLLHIFNFF